MRVYRERDHRPVSLNDDLTALLENESTVLLESWSAVFSSDPRPDPTGNRFYEFTWRTNHAPRPWRRQYSGPLAGIGSARGRRARAGWRQAAGRAGSAQVDEDQRRRAQEGRIETRPGQARSIDQPSQGTPGLHPDFTIRF